VVSAAVDGAARVHLISHVDELVDLDVGVVELTPEHLDRSSHSLPPPHICNVRDSGHELELRRRVRKRNRARDIASVDGLGEPPNQLDVVLRHRPPSIPVHLGSANG
jgi:hypothetical protein